MTTTATRKATRDERKETSAAVHTAEVKSLDTLKQAFRAAEAQGNEAQALFDTAKLTIENMNVFKSRAAYAVATHPEVLTTYFVNRTTKANERERDAAKAEGRKPELAPMLNYSGASKALGVARNTLRPYIDAGAKLAAKELAGNVGEPTDEERDIVRKAIDAVNRAEERKAKGDKPDTKAKTVAPAKGDEGEPGAFDEATPPSMAEVLAKAEALHAMAKLYAEAEDSVRPEVKEAGRLSELMMEVELFITSVQER